jgi:GNAT superfamily N-acetyltransferase
LFESAVPGDVDELVGLRDRVARWLVERGIQQWQPGEFSVARMRTWVDRGDVYVHRREGRIVAAVAVLEKDPDIWGDQPADAAYVHLLMVDRAHAGAGLGAAALSYAEGRARDLGAHRARLDAVASNPWLRRWYEDRGYEVVGSRSFEDPGPFGSLLFEKPLA